MHYYKPILTYSFTFLKSTSTPMQPNTQPSTLQTCITLIEQSKSEIKQKLSQYFEKLKKNLLASLDKAQKIYHNKINQTCTSSIDCLTKLVSTQLYFLSVEKYTHQTKKLINALKTINIEEQLKNFTNQIKTNIEQVKKLKILQSLPKINQQDSLMKLSKIIKIDHQPLQKITTINNKLIQIRENTVTIEKNTINKIFDLILPIKFKNKNKQIIFTLHDHSIGIYNDKLILHSFKKFLYTKGKIIGAIYIGNYVIIAQSNKIIKININNLNQTVQRVFNEDIFALGNELYCNLIQIGTNEKLIMLDFNTLQPLTFLSINSRIKKIITTKDSPYLLITLPNGLRIYKDMQLLQITGQQRLRDILQIRMLFNKFIIVTNQLHIFCLHLENQQNQLIEIQRINQGGTKIIKSVAVRGYEVYCLAENGSKIYVYSF